MAEPFSLPAFFDARDDARDVFLAAHDFAGAAITPLYEDMASRRFFRLRQSDRSAVLMDSLPDDHPQATMGHRLADYTRLSTALREAGVQAPAVFAADKGAGFLLIEDLGDQKISETQLPQAVDVLIRLRGSFAGNALDLPGYFSAHIHTARRRVVDWYVPCALGHKNPDGWVEDYLAVWKDIEKTVPDFPQGFVHADYHRGNLLWHDNNVGVLDFQGAQWGPPLYDLVNLLEDGRVDLDAGLKSQLKDRYKDGLLREEKESFDLWYAILSTQFHARLAGQFIKMALAGKTAYMAHLPRVQAYLKQDLAHPALAPLANWFTGKGITFTEKIVPQAMYIRPDAF